MSSDLKCQTHRNRAIYVNTDTSNDVPTLLCHKCILTHNHNAVLLDEFLIEQNTNIPESIQEVSLEDQVINQCIDSLKSQLLTLFNEQVETIIKNISQTHHRQQELLDEIKKLANPSENLEILDPEEYFRALVRERSTSASPFVRSLRKHRVLYFREQLSKVQQNPPIPNMDGIIAYWTSVLSINTTQQKNLFRNEIKLPDFKIEVQKQDLQFLRDSDFSSTKSLVLHDFHLFTAFIQNIELHITEPIKSIKSLSHYKFLESLTLIFHDVQMLTDFTIPGLRQLRINCSDNQYSSIDSLTFPESLTLLHLNFQNNSIKSLKLLSESLQNLFLDDFCANFNGFTTFNLFNDEGLEDLCVSLRRYRLSKLTLRLQKCGLTQRSIIALVQLLQSQRLKSAQFDLAQNRFVTVNSLYEVLKRVRNAKINQEISK